MRRAMVATAAACLVLTGLAPGGTSAPAARMVKDIRTGRAGSDPQELTSVGGRLFFSARARDLGLELWTSDGTEAGTVLVKDIRHGSDSSAPRGLIEVGGTLYFFADDGTHGVELWKSDGTEGGTVPVKDVAAGAAGAWDFGAGPCAAVDDTLFFSADDGVHGVELWRSDGTAAGTSMVRDIWPGPEPSAPYGCAAVDGTVFFFADDGTHGRELWASDGTAAGTAMVLDIAPGQVPSFGSDLTSFSGSLFFFAADGSGDPELWRSDGTAAGTEIVGPLGPGCAHGDCLFELTPVGDSLYFSFRNTRGDQLWRSDGTTAGTVSVKDIHPIPTCPAVWLTDVAGALFFNAGEGRHGEELWRSDGTAAGTGLVKDAWPGPARFPDSDEFCQYGPRDLMDVAGTLFFVVDDGTHGEELWRSDGTSGGTTMVADIRTGLNPYGGGLGSVPSELTDVDGTLFFAANDGAHGVELWRSR